MTTLQNTEMQ